MKLAMAAFGIATLVGIGYVIGKKMSDKRKAEEDFLDFDDFDDDDLYDDTDVCIGGKEQTDGYGNKIKKASLFAVGAIKTGADKIGECVQDIKTKDMVKKGEKTFDAVKDAGGNIKNDIKRDIEDLKGAVASIGDEEGSDIDSISDATRVVADEVKDLFES